MSTYKDIGVEKVGHVGSIEIRRPPLNFFDISLINQIADALEEFDRDIEIRSSVLSAQGKAFCAGANFNDPARQEQEARAAEGIGRLVAQVHTMRRMSVSVAGMLQAGKEPVVEASIVKDIGTVWEQQLPHRVRDLAAFVEEEVGNRETLEQQLSFAIKTAPKLTIQGGTTEVLRGIIARGLGLR